MARNLLVKLIMGLPVVAGGNMRWIIPLVVILSAIGFLTGCAGEEDSPSETATGSAKSGKPAGTETGIATGTGRTPTFRTIPGKEPEPPLKAVSKCGKYRLGVERSRQLKGVVSIELRLQTLSKSGKAAPDQMQKALFCGRPRPVYQTIAGDGSVSDNAARTHCYWGQNRIEINGLKFGANQTSIRELNLTLHIYVATEWKDLVFAGIGKGKSGPHFCGPFEITTNGLDNAFIVCIAHHSIYSHKHKAFQEETGLKSLTYYYGFNRLQLVDSAGDRLCRGMLSGTGGGGSRDYVILDKSKPRINGLYSIHKRIKYPVTIKLKMPAAGKVEKAEFSLKDVALPANGYLFFKHDWDAEKRK